MSNSGIPEGAWVLIADGEKALFLENVGDAEVVLDIRPVRSLVKMDQGFI